MSAAERLVLVADDDRDILGLVALRLERSGWRVLQASDGEEALRLATEYSPDLVVLDLMMPKLTGLEVTRMLRADERTRNLPVILLTARVQEQDVAEGYAAGVTDYVKKPFSPQDLHDRAVAILRTRVEA